MQRLDRLERVTDLLLVLLDSPRPLSLRDIAYRVPGYPESHGARRQAFERDKRLLREEGVPVLVVKIDGEDQLGYRVDPDAYYLPDLGLEAEEQAALNLAVAGVHLGEPIGHQALLKLGAGGESPLRDTPVPLVDLPSFDGLPALPALFDAIRRKAVVDFVYRGEPRRVDVAGLRFRGRPLVPDRLRPRPGGGPDLPGRPHRRRPGARTAPSRPGCPMASTPTRPSAVTRGSSARARRSRWTCWSMPPRPAGWWPNWGRGPSSSGREDGTVVVRLSVTDTGALILWVLDLLDHAEVLRPPEVRAAVVGRLRASATAPATAGPPTVEPGVR